MNKKIIEIIFTYGQLSHPHFKENVVIETRRKEANKAAKQLGINKVIFLGLDDRNIKGDIEKKNIKSKVKKIIQQYNPEKIFTLSQQDTHLDHRAVNRTILSVVDSSKKDYPVFTFQIWGKDLKENPKMYKNITPYFKKKIQIMKVYESQWHFIYPLLIPVYIRAKLNGIKNHCKYAEVFQKIR